VSASGHEDQFRPPSLNGGCRLAEATLAGTHGNEQEAPIPAVRGTATEPLEATLSGFRHRRPEARISDLPCHQSIKSLQTEKPE
jgi:hypothetical protein